MIVLVDVPNTRAKNVDFKKNKATEKVSPSDKGTFVHAHVDRPADSLNKDIEDNNVDTTFFWEYCWLCWNQH